MINKDDARYNCVYCGEHLPTCFVVKNELWESVAKHHRKQIICWFCFEKLFGRKLELEDLKQYAKCNDTFVELFNRMKRK